MPNTQDLKYKVLSKLFVPDASFSFPVSEFNQRKLKFQHKWLDKWECLAYSKLTDEAFCNYCILLSSDCLGKGTHQNIGSLTTSPFWKWKNGIEKITKQRKNVNKIELHGSQLKKLLFSVEKMGYLSEEIMTVIIQQKFVTPINNNANCFSILGDETLDVSGQEQFSLCIRYVYNEGKAVLREDFLYFLPIYDMSSKKMFKTILNTCENLGLNMD
ncbi:hypothetical protein PR048_011009 [Dryococelus australis]|uniref:Zinc finger MYM-type protein 1-like n=1 Tax=Dryococelus australis TaxID=614101 RepID=A0ABQ9HLN4_9NEOP|nr:hypothetical protein PR048_011009 [Dryococelus australis]